MLQNSIITPAETIFFVLFDTTLHQVPKLKRFFPLDNGDLCCSLLLIPAMMLFCHCVTHDFSNAVGNKLALPRKYGLDGCIQVSVQEKCVYSALRLRKFNLRLSSQTAPRLGTRFSVPRHDSLQKRAAANILRQSATNKICCVLWEKAAGMIMEEEAGRKKDRNNLFWTESIPKTWAEIFKKC